MGGIHKKGFENGYWMSLVVVVAFQIVNGVKTLDDNYGYKLLIGCAYSSMKEVTILCVNAG